MTHDLILAERIRAELGGQAGLTEKKMFGGVGYMLHGNLACGVYRDQMIVRVGPQAYPAALAQPHTHPLDITGRAMTGWIMVSPEGCADEGAFQRWVAQGLAFAASLPPK